MKISAIRDEKNRGKNLGYLVYYENSGQFYIELPQDADPWETPLLLESFLRRGERTINAYYSRLWVQQRIVPTDRQNLGQILKENGLDEYDEYKLLMLAAGRCAQDSYYLEPMEESELPEEVRIRCNTRVEDIIPLDDAFLLVFFRDGIVKKCNIKDLVQNNRRFMAIIDNQQLFENVKIQPGGYGITWGQELDIADKVLYEKGEFVPLSARDFICFASQRVVNTSEVAEILGCSRQNIDDLTKRGKLNPIKTTQQGKLFLKSEVLQRKW